MIISVALLWTLSNRSISFLHYSSEEGSTVIFGCSLPFSLSFPPHWFTLRSSEYSWQHKLPETVYRTPQQPLSCHSSNIPNIADLLGGKPKNYRTYLLSVDAKCSHIKTLAVLSNKIPSSLKPRSWLRILEHHLLASHLPVYVFLYLNN